MPTSRPRHTITESDDLAQALDDAARCWPEDAGSRSRLLLRLAAQGHAALRSQSEERKLARRAATQRTSGVLTGVYPPEYLAQLRDDWPD